MTIQNHFPNPPITEALFDIRVDLPKDVDIKALSQFQEKFKDVFPERQVKMEWNAQFELKQNFDPKIVSSEPKQNGFLYYSPDKKKIVQARLDGFTFNKLKPYDSWKSFSKEAMGLWEHYRNISKPVKIKRIALRYINRINLPLPIESLDEYFQTKPVIGKEIHQQLESFLMKLVLPTTIGNPNKAVIIQTTAESKDSKVVPMILDIDVYRELEIDPNDIDTLSKLFEELHKYKNMIFFSSITDKTQKLFY